MLRLIVLCSVIGLCECETLWGSNKGGGKFYVLVLREISSAGYVCEAVVIINRSVAWLWPTAVLIKLTLLSTIVCSLATNRYIIISNR